MTLNEFNHRFLAALDTIAPQLRHTSSGSNRRHPLLRSVLLKAVKEDIEVDRLEAAWEKWKYFCGVKPCQDAGEQKPASGLTATLS